MEFLAIDKAGMVLMSCCLFHVTCAVVPAAEHGGQAVDCC